MVEPKRMGIVNEISETLGITVRVFERGILHFAKICGKTARVATRASTKAVDGLFNTHAAVLGLPERVITLPLGKRVSSSTERKATAETASLNGAEKTSVSGQGKKEEAAQKEGG